MTIHDIEQKISNDGATPKGQLTAEEFNTVVSTVVKHDGEITRVTYWDMVNNTQYGFASEDDRDKWLDGDVTVAPTQVTKFQFAGKQRVMKVINLMPSTNIYFTTNQAEAIISASFVSQEKEITASDWTTIPEDAFFSVYVDKGGTGTYQEVLANKLVLDGNTFTFDVKNYLATGANRVRIVAVGSSSGESGSLQLSVNLTSMFIEPSNFTWYTPFIEGQPYRLGGFRIGGNIVKNLMIKVSKEGYNPEPIKIYLGTNTYLTTAYSFNGLEFPEAGSGVYNVECWLDANGLESDHLSYNIIFVSAADHESGRTQMVAINNFADKVYNFSDNRLFQYCIYNGGLTIGTPHVRLASLVNNTPTIFLDEDLANVRTGAALDYIASLEVELQDENLEITLDARMIYGNEQQVLYAVDNSKSYPAATGASFYLNASSRSNAQENREFVVNAVNSASYEATFTRMAWTDGVDGWTTDDEGRKCLRLPAMSPMEFAFKPLATVPQDGKTIEFLFKVKNVADYNEPIISITNTDGDDFAGIRITPKNVLIHSQQANSPSNNALQDYNTTDEEVLDVVITVIPQYREIYGNLAKIYVNGENVRSFEYQNGDRWNVDSIVKLGNQTSDFFLYKMRVYERGFQSTEARDNYINSLPTTKEKEAKKAELYAPTDDNGYALSYDSCVKNGLNTMVIEILGNDQTIPSIQNQSAKQSNVWITINDPIAGELDEDFATLFSGAPILNQTIEGQGTTAMTYARWNFRWKLDKTYNKRRITAKKNFASSMHSHKMGATRLFNDLNLRCVGANDAAKRTAVFQYPVYGFQKILLEGTTNVYEYVPIGLYTIGPDKGDKDTFGFGDERFENTVIHLEGTDHTPLGVGMDYPWSKLVYSSEDEGIGAINASNAVVAAWEVGAAGEYETGTYQEYEGGPVLDDSVEVRALLDAEFKPAYEVAYNNSTYIEGVTETLIQINSDVNAWQERYNADGIPYTGLEFWTDGVYDIYFYNTQAKKYEANGVNILTDLGLSTSDVSGMTIAEKNELFKRLRRERFSANWGNYWHTDDAIFHYAFILLFGATDNFKKNTYPYKFKALNDGGRWRWRQDDLDTLFDINNQGLAAKTYSILVGDKTSTGSGSIYRGDDSRFWTLVKETQQAKIKTMVHSIFDKMVELSPYGSNKLDKVVGCIRHYFWDKAQNYFPSTAYNADAEWTYEDTWVANLYKEVNPLSQSLGGHYEAERDWVAMRVLFAASYYNYGPFDAGKTNYSDTSTGQIAYGGAASHTFKFVPSIDFNPTILRGQTEFMSVGERIKAGETAELTVPTSTGSDTRVYVQGVDWMKDIGDLSTLQVTADNSDLTIGSKRLQRLKIGDEDASKVTSNVKALTFNECPSIMLVDARNLSSLGGTIDLSLMPRLLEAYFGGTAVRGIIVPKGSKIEVLELSPELMNLSLQDLKFMSLDGLRYNSLDKVRLLRIEGCDQLNPFDMLKSIYNSDSHELRDVRIVGFVSDGDANDLTMISNMVKDKDKNGNDHIYNGVDANGNGVDDTNPVIEGTLNINSGAYEDDIATLRGAYPNLVLNILGGIYIRFEDPEVLRVLLEKITTDDGLGLKVEDVEGVTDISNWFAGNTSIKEFNEFEKFENVTTLGNSNGSYRWAFSGCSSLETIRLPEGMTKIFDGNNNYGGVGGFLGCVSLKNVSMPESLVYIGNCAFRGCTSLDEIDLSNVKHIGIEVFNACNNLKKIYNLGKLETLMGSAFKGCTALAIDVNMPNLQSGEIPASVFEGSGIVRVIDLGNVASIIAGGAFIRCQSLVSANLRNIVNIGDYAFQNCTALEQLTLSPNMTKIGAYAFSGCTSLKGVYDLSSVVEIGQYAFMDCAIDGVTLRDAVLIDRIAFANNRALVIESLNLPNITRLGGQAFQNVKVKRIDNLGSITSWDYSSNTSNAYTFRGAPLEFLRIPSTMTVLQNTAFYGVTTTPTVVCEAITPPTLNGATGIPQNASVIYVPCASIPSYKAATNWTTYADRIGPIEDYEDGGWVKFADPAVESICVANWDTNGSGYMSENECAAVTSIGTIFRGNTEITSFDEFEKFTGIKQIYSAWNNQAFGQCTSLEYVTLPRGLEATSTTNYGPFDGCTKLKRVRFSTPVPRMVGEVFSGCTSLTTLEGFDMSAVTEMNYRTFYNCTSLVIEDANFPNLTGKVDEVFHKTKIRKISNLGSITHIEDGRYDWGFCFGCVELTEVVLPSTLTSIGTYNFSGCTSLTKIEIPESVSNLGGNLFQGCTTLTSVVVRNTTPPAAGANMFHSTPIAGGTGYIYVPDASVDAYKAATNWATYAAKIKPLSEYDPDAEGGGDVGTDTEVTFEQSVALQSNGTTTTNATLCTTSYMPISNSTRVRWGNTNGNIGILCEYKDGYAFSDYWSASQNPRTVNLTGGTNVKYIRASFPMNTLDYCYVLDVTNNVYLYKGSKVE